MSRPNMKDFKLRHMLLENPKTLQQEFIQCNDSCIVLQYMQCELLLESDDEKGDFDQNRPFLCAVLFLLGDEGKLRCIFQCDWMISHVRVLPVDDL